MKSTRLMTTLAILSAGLLTIGCHQPPQPTTLTVARITAPTPDDYDLLWECVGDTLRRHYFPLDRQDRQQGVISTHLETSPHFVEWWRPRPKPNYYWWESNLHTIQRQATVNIHPVDQPGTYDLEVTIDRYRYSLEERQIDNSAAALRLYSSEAPTTSGQSLKSSESAYWIPLGRDEPMEQTVLTSIIRRYGHGEIIEPLPDELTQQP